MREVAGLRLSPFNIAVLRTMGLIDCVGDAFSYLRGKLASELNTVREQLVLCFYLLPLLPRKQ